LALKREVLEPVDWPGLPNSNFKLANFYNLQFFLQTHKKVGKRLNAYFLQFLKFWPF
jgi:hypothetical protein